MNYEHYGLNADHKEVEEATWEGIKRLTLGI